ncbi:MAG: carboxypeptidase-like regulatory domain-containing protein, partial [Candidatus Wallbacteria bacterium]|nr:carboxypeptidase-like regulatory domain-containing protein [Candidatus Wallbacteria bacterium]
YQPQDTEIDLFCNEMIERTLVTEKNILPDFHSHVYWPGDGLKWNVYLPDGTSRSQSMVVPEDFGLLIPHGKTRFSCQQGFEHTSQDPLRQEFDSAAVDAAIGIHDQITIGCSFREQYLENYRRMETGSLLLSIRPSKRVLLHAEALRADSLEVFDTMGYLDFGRYGEIKYQKRFGCNQKLPDFYRLDEQERSYRFDFRDRRFHVGQLHGFFSSEGSNKRFGSEFSSFLNSDRWPGLSPLIILERDFSEGDRLGLGASFESARFILRMETTLAGTARNDYFMIHQATRRLNGLSWKRKRTIGDRTDSVTLKYHQNRLEWESGETGGQEKNRVSMDLVLWKKISLVGGMDFKSDDYDLGIKWTFRFGAATRGAPVDPGAFRTGAVSGRMTDRDGNAVSGAELSCGGKKVLSDSKGRYRIEGLPTGCGLILDVSPLSLKTDERVLSGSHGISLRPGSGVKVDFTVIHTGGCDGALNTESAENIRMWIIRAERASGERIETSVNSDGSFVLEGMETGAVYRIIAVSPEGIETVCLNELTISRKERWKSGLVITPGRSG